MKYAVLTYSYFGGWEDNWTEGDNRTPLRYDTFEEAERELAEFLAEANDAGLGYDAEDYRIVMIADKEAR